MALRENLLYKIHVSQDQDTHSSHAMRGTIFHASDGYVNTKLFAKKTSLGWDIFYTTDIIAAISWPSPLISQLFSPRFLKAALFFTAWLVLSEFDFFLYFQTKVLRLTISSYLQIIANCYRNNDDHTNDTENYLLIPDSYQQREKTISIIDDKKTNNLDKGVLRHMLPLT